MRERRLVPTFRSSRTVSATPFGELWKVMGTNKLVLPVPLIDLRSLRRTRRLWFRDFVSAVLSELEAAF
jgi:hypothetical protein